MRIEPDDRPDSWRAVDDDTVIGAARLLRRPDDRRAVYLRGHRDGVRAALLAEVAGAVDGEICTTAEEDGEVARKASDLGFVVRRRDSVYRIPVRQQPGAVPAGFTVISAAAADRGRLRELDDALRQDVPGCAGWHSTPEEFAGQLDGPDFDPATYLVAVDDTGAYAGLVRIWRYPQRLGLIGVLAPHRNRGLARGLLARAFAVLRDRGVVEVTAEADETNVASTTLLRSLGATVTGTELELIRPAPR
jgi:RimJ/RimL family protein N-acetyltransferase